VAPCITTADLVFATEGNKLCYCNVKKEKKTEVQNLDNSQCLHNAWHKSFQHLR